MTDDTDTTDTTDTDHPRLEFTIGVCVPMEWDKAAGRYVLGTLTTTTGGLFSDAEEGAWAPDLDTWVDTCTDDQVDAHDNAEAAVRRAIGIQTTDALRRLRAEYVEWAREPDASDGADLLVDVAAVLGWPKPGAIDPEDTTP